MNKTEIAALYNVPAEEYLLLDPSIARFVTSGLWVSQADPKRHPWWPTSARSETASLVANIS